MAVDGQPKIMTASSVMQSGQFLQAANDAGVRSRPLRGFLAGIPSEGKPVDALGVASSDGAAAAVSDARARVLSFSDAHSFRADKGEDTNGTVAPRGSAL